MMFTEVFNIFFHLAGLILVFGILRQEKGFNYFIGVILVTTLMHLFAIYMEIGSPFALLYGPVIYFAHRANSKAPVKRKAMFMHLLPFAVFFLYYLILTFAIISAASWVKTAYLYYPFYFVAMLVSLGSYSLVIFFENKRNASNELRKLIIGQLCIFNLIIASLIALLIMKMLIWPDYLFGVDVKMLINSLLAVTSLFMASYLYKSFTKTEHDFTSGELIENITGRHQEKYRDYSLDENVLIAYASKIDLFLKDTKLYLNTNLSLDLLSEKTQIPRHHLSQVFNLYLRKNFYQTIATYRIDYALNLLQEDRNITFESLAYECGFNSKTSFNRYFKDQTGYTPSEYRSQISSEEQGPLFDNTFYR